MITFSTPKLITFGLYGLARKITFLPSLNGGIKRSKRHFKNISIKRSTTLKKSERTERRQLENKINFYKDLYSSETVDQHKQNMFLQIKMPQLSANNPGQNR